MNYSQSKTINYNARIKQNIVEYLDKKQIPNFRNIETNYSYLSGAGILNHLTCKEDLVEPVILNNASRAALNCRSTNPLEEEDESMNRPEEQSSTFDLHCNLCLVRLLGKIR
jgi:hypothetical protein